MYHLNSINPYTGAPHKYVESETVMGSDVSFKDVLARPSQQFFKVNWMCNWTMWSKKSNGEKNVIFRVG